MAGPSPRRRFALPALAALAFGTLDLFWGLGGPASGFIVSLCAAKLAAMVTVSAAIAIATPLSRPSRQIAAAALLFATFLGRGARDINRMILTGVIPGVFFRSLTTFVARLMGPYAYAVPRA